ncbi:MAG TPA: CHAT domain-containing protein, partial [Cytophagaceae bacterium]|nr:CHAT domain-containing protein [Cytophagaceae bacterium]
TSGGLQKAVIEDLQAELWMDQGQWNKVEKLHLNDLFLNVRRDIHFGAYDKAKNSIEWQLNRYKDQDSKKYAENFVACLPAIKMLFLSEYENEGSSFYIDSVWNKANKYYTALYGKDSIPYLELLFDMGKEYKRLEKEETATALFKEVYDIGLAHYGKYNAFTTDASNELADLSVENGYLTKAQKLLDQTNALATETYGEQTVAYVLLLETYLAFDIQQGRNSEGKKKYEKILPVIVKEHGKRSLNYAILVFYLSKLSSNENDFEQAAILVKDAITINEANGVDCNPCFINLLVSLANVYVEAEEWNKAEATYRRAWQFLEDHTDELKDELYYLSITRSLADFYTLCKALKVTDRLTYYPDDSLIDENGKKRWVSKTGDEKAFTDNRIIETYKENIAYYTKQYGSKHPEVAGLKYLSAYYYWISQDHFNASREFNTSLDLSIAYAKLYLPYLSEKEKSSFYKTIDDRFDAFYTFGFEEKGKTTYILEQDLSYYKKIMGGDTVNYVFSKDTVMSNQLNKTYSSGKNSTSTNQSWIRVKNNVISSVFNYRLATKGILFHTTRNVKRRIIVSGDTLLIQAYNRWEHLHNQLAKLYTSSSKDTTGRAFQIDSLEKKAYDLQGELSEQSMLFKKNNDEKKYNWQDIQKALKAGEAAVEIIRFTFPLRSGKKDSICYAALIVTSETKENPQVVLLHNGNDMEKKYYSYYLNAIKYTLNDEVSYDIYWNSINRYLVGKKTIYFSPDGIYNVLNLSTLKNNTGTYLLEEKDIRLLTDLTDLVNVSEKEPYTNKATIIGDPDFNGKNLPLAPSDTIHERSIMMEDLLRGGIEELPGTKVETDQIARLLSKEGWEIKLLQRNLASEKQIKSVKETRLLHLATHGFFIKETVLENENPLLRSGLLFSGATGVDDFYQEEDNILTAYEAMNLSLEHTELVVLSACETGLGEIRKGEGVYGLQRAFRTAGCKNIIMS